ncbi:conserved hypothetical protein [Vibrio crassostreae]|nr:conserved hypothetical protein [Vibrio crassostreae]
MNQKRLIQTDRQTGEKEFVVHEQHQPKNRLGSGISKISSHFSASESLEQERLERVAAESKRMAAAEEKRVANYKELERIDAEKKAQSRQVQRENQVRATKESENTLASAMAANRQKHTGFRK